MDSFLKNRIVDLLLIAEKASELDDFISSDEGMDEIANLTNSIECLALDLLGVPPDTTTTDPENGFCRDFYNSRICDCKNSRPALEKLVDFILKDLERLKVSQPEAFV